MCPHTFGTGYNVYQCIALVSLCLPFFSEFLFAFAFPPLLLLEWFLGMVELILSFSMISRIVWSWCVSWGIVFWFWSYWFYLCTVHIHRSSKARWASIGHSGHNGLHSLCAVVDAWQILNVTVELFYACEEGVNHDALGLVKHVMDIDLLTFCSIFVKDDILEDCAGQEMHMTCCATCGICNHIGHSSQISSQASYF